MTFFVRRKAGQPPVMRGPMLANPHHWAPCPACGDPFIKNEEVYLLALGPGRRPDAQERHDSGRCYSSVAVQIHAECSAYRPDSEPVDSGPDN